VSDSANVVRVEKVEMTQSRHRFEIAADRAPKEMTLDPNAWILMEPPKFTKR
jgi:hypothetical protein